MSKIKKERIDLLLVKRGMVQSRERAQAVIMAGKVFVDGRRVEKAGQQVTAEAEIELKGPDHPYVSRGGVKLEAALKNFKIDPAGRTALDIGSSTGGFTDCLLQHGASSVIAVDVGRGLIDYKLRTDERVKLIENLNARYITMDDIGQKVDIIVIDVAFISLTLIIPALPPLLKPEGVFIPLVKPQFEVGREEVEKGGIIRSKDKHLAVLKKIILCAEECGFRCEGFTPSPIEGNKGNREFFLKFLLSDKQSGYTLEDLERDV